MATVTFILGLCGAGKTWLAERIKAEAKFEDFLLDRQKHTELIRHLSSGRDCVVIEIAYCIEAPRREIVQELAIAAPGTKIHWICFENNLEIANKNCLERTNKGDPEGHIKINNQISPYYTYPEGSQILKMWTRGL